MAHPVLIGGMRVIIGIQIDNGDIVWHKKVRIRLL